MEVVIYSTIATAPGQVTVICNDDQTVDSIISAFCTEQGIRHQKEYVIRNIKHELLPNVRKIRTCGIQNGDIMYLGVSVQSERWLGTCNQWWLVGAVALLIGAVGLVAISVLKVNGTIQPLDYGVVIDAGSSHSQVFVYKWEADKYINTAIAQQIYTQRAEGGGISSYSDDPQKAGASLKQILDGAKGKVPASSHKKSPVFLGATAGMRLLDTANKTASDAIMSSVRSTMNTYPFNFSVPDQQAVILPGQDEGTFGWITVNYLLEMFGKTDMMTYLRLSSPSPNPNVVGALDMGGASTQLTFYPEKPEQLPEKESSSLVLYGEQYKIYSHSYLCYGLNEMKRSYNALLVKAQNYSQTLYDPCRPTGFNATLTFSQIFELPCTESERSFVPLNVLTNMSFTFVGASNGTECHQNVHGLFNFTADCQTQPCSFNGVHQPPVRGNYLAFSGFYYTTSYFNLTGNFTLKAFQDKYNTHCGKPWSKLPHDGFDSDMCLQANYIDILLTDGYKFNNDTWKHINFRNNVRNTDLGWSLGFMLNISNIIPAEYPTQSISIPVFIILVLLFACFIGLAVAFAIYAMSLKKTTDKKYEKLKTYGSV